MIPFNKGHFLFINIADNHDKMFPYVVERHELLWKVIFIYVCIGMHSYITHSTVLSETKIKCQ